MVTDMSWNMIKRWFLSDFKNVSDYRLVYFYRCYNLKKKTDILELPQTYTLFQKSRQKSFSFQNYTYNQYLSNLAKCFKCEYAFSNHFQTHIKLKRFLSSNRVYNWFLTIMSHLEIWLMHNTIWKFLSPCL